MNKTAVNIVKYFGAWLSLVALLIALPMIMGATWIPETSIWHHVLRDLGISFLVAALVGVVFELHMRVRFSNQTMEDVLNIAMGELIDPEVWKEAKCQVLSRDIIRKNGHIHLSVEPIGGQPARAIFHLEFEYDLCGLHARPRNVELVHELDDFLKYGDYPRFQYIQVGKERYDGERLKGELKDGRFAVMVELPGKDGKSISVIGSREEVVYLPGSYTLTMAELTNGITLHLEGLPDGIEAEVTLRPHTQSPVALKKDVPLNSEFTSLLLLPGQGIEFRFRAKADQAIRPAVPTAAVAA